MLWGLPKGIFWHSPRENRLLWDSENEGHANAVYVNYMSCAMGYGIRT